MLNNCWKIKKHRKKTRNTVWWRSTSLRFRDSKSKLNSCRLSWSMWKANSCHLMKRSPCWTRSKSISNNSNRRKWTCSGSPSLLSRSDLKRMHSRLNWTLCLRISKQVRTISSACSAKWGSSSQSAMSYVTAKTKLIGFRSRRNRQKRSCFLLTPLTRN